MGAKMDLALEGVDVVIASSDEAAITTAAKRIADEAGVRAIPVAADLGSADGVNRWVQAATSELGGVDLLFTNTGGPPPGGFMDFDDPAWQRAFDLLVMSAVRSVRAVVPIMRERGGGAIVVSTSSSVIEPIPGLTLSTVLRAAVSSLAKTLSNELAADNIRVNQIVPGSILTDRIRSLNDARAKQSGLSPEQVQEQTARSIPMGRIGDPEEYGKAAVFLFSDAASYVTGETLRVDGGSIRSIV
jgi:3-oxoacyl-[acyl-carrier protein] reductase